MQLHNIKSSTKRKNRKRVGRGGKRGTYSGKGNKGQKSRSGTSWRPDFRGGNAPIWKLFSKQRGANSKTEIKHRRSGVKKVGLFTVKISELSGKFKEGDTITKKSMVSAGLTKKYRDRIKVLGDGELSGKFNFVGVFMSKSAKDKVLKAGGTVK